jgi:ATP/maltotriose-dependent transcriptional regulator MalT
MLKQLKGFGLTDREEEVLVLISQGYKNAEIAEKMFVSLNTIKTHTKNIFIKLDVKNRTQAAKKAQIVH